MGLAGRRGDTGENKVDDTYSAELLQLIEGSPQEHGYQRFTWMQELLISVLAERTGICVSITTMLSAPAMVGGSAEPAQTDRRLPPKRPCAILGRLGKGEAPST